MNILVMSLSKRIGLTYHLTQLSVSLKQVDHNVMVGHSGGEQQRGLKKLLRNDSIPLFTLPAIDTLSWRMLKPNAFQPGRIIDKENVDIIHANGLSHLFNVYVLKRAN
mgnify:CR=1 FL=1